MRFASRCVALGFILILAACNRPASPPAPPAQTADNAATPAELPPIGVAECDEYVTKIRQCFAEKVPEPQRQAVLKLLDQSRSGWVQLASTPEGRKELGPYCKHALEQGRAQYAAFGCSL